MTKKQISNQNFDDKIVELLLRTDFDRSQLSNPISVDLRCTTGRIGNEDIIFRFGIRKGYLELVLDGLDEVPGTRFNDSSTIGSEVNETISREQIKGFSSQATTRLSADVSALSAKARANVEAQLSHEGSRGIEAKIVQQTSWSQASVTARPGLVWEVLDSRVSSKSGLLDATYLQHDELVHFSTSKGANRHAYQLRFFSQFDDLVILESSPSGVLAKSISALKGNKKVLKDMIVKRAVAEKIGHTVFDSHESQVTFSMCFHDLAEDNEGT